uniref:Glycosyltransferase 61 catalytic domain-containing protein n=1 Tax=Haptolina brevifila TaxID=156173 RepID=A0A7S2CDW5_9EUKA|mmetsp:Transcript_23848/g.47615  ORF Transcript_23848/g.47615 Transcript_23848/m.47615 type:complete len:166 (+) Transcript_23848:2-499(+)
MHMPHAYAICTFICIFICILICRMHMHMHMCMPHAYAQGQGQTEPDVHVSRGTLDLQIRLLSKARIVVGQHGAGLSNIVGCAPHTTLIELPPRHSHCYAVLADKMAMHYHFHDSALFDTDLERVLLQASKDTLGAAEVDLAQVRREIHAREMYKRAHNIRHEDAV